MWKRWIRSSILIRRLPRDSIAHRELVFSSVRIPLSMGERYNASWVAAEVARCSVVWHECGVQPIALDAQSSLRDHESREIAYDTALREVEWEAKRLARDPSDRVRAEQRMIASFARFAQNALDLEEEQIALLADGFLPAGIDFARRARQFDPDLSREDTIQACRNAWTACGLQPLLGVPSGITPSILAYSLLYPYSDNYLDSADVPNRAKHTFNARFRERLRGCTAPAVNRREAAVWALVDRIEQQYPRATFPDVFDCLLAIHRAQEDSVIQLGHSQEIDDAELLRVSLAKGGTSVLADACLVRGAVTAEESRVAFEWGALLQLGDDLQDVADDLDRGSQTLFTRAAKEGEPLDALVLQLLSFCERAAVRVARLPHGSKRLKDLLKMSWRSLILGAVAEGSDFFSPSFLLQAERGSPFRFEFLRARRKRLACRQGLYSTLFDLFVRQPASPVSTPSCEKTRPESSFETEFEAGEQMPVY